MLTYKCSGPVFEGLKCPYTGKPLQVVMHVTSRGRAYFSAPDAYSTACVYKSPKEAYRAWNHVDGVEGLKDGQPLVCAYTGKPLVLKRSDDGFCYDGGFDPRALLSREQFLHFATMRGGKSPVSLETSRVDMPKREGKITENMRKHADEQRTELSDDSVKIAENILQANKDILPSGPATISVDRSGIGGKGGKGKKGAH